MTQVTTVREYTHGHLFGAIGGGAKGFNAARARLGNTEGRYRCVGSVDVDAGACLEFQKVTGVKATCRDLFSVEQYIAFHGKLPPVGWEPALPHDIRAAMGGEFPDVGFLSAPCKGFSGLLSEASSKTDKYQALNELTVRAVWLWLEAFKDDPSSLIFFENVPRIENRGDHLLAQIASMFAAYGYAWAQTKHNCGEIGNLAQSRPRFLGVARHIEKVPPFLYEPYKHRLRGVGEVLDRLPLPGDERMGPMHRVPMLQFKTWVRLAFVEAGSDWRSLNRLRVEDGVLADYGLIPDRPLRNGAYGVAPWVNYTGAVCGESFPSNGPFALADPRSPAFRQGFLGVHEWAGSIGVVAARAGPTNGAYAVSDPRSAYWGSCQVGVLSWAGCPGVVTGQRSPLQGTFSVADPRMFGVHHGVLGVVEYRGPAGVVAGASKPLNGRFAVADCRIDGHHKSVQFGVLPYGNSMGVITGDMWPGCGVTSLADPRLAGAGPRFNNVYRIVPWKKDAKAVTGAGATSNAAPCVADPRGEAGRHVNGKYRVAPFDAAAGAVIAGSTTGNGAFALADPRMTWGPTSHTNKLKVALYGGATGVVTGTDRVGSGALCLADPRTGWPSSTHHNLLHVTDYTGGTKVVTGACHVAGGALSVADPRPTCLNAPARQGYVSQGHYGVTAWPESAGSIPGFAKNNNGRWSVADPRPGYQPDPSGALPKPNDRLICVIRALDDTWHRPFTTFELAALQGFVDPDDIFGWDLSGRSDSQNREWIGNAVPPPAARAMAAEGLRTLLMAEAGETFALSSTPIWVRDIAIALSMDTSGQPT